MASADFVEGLGSAGTAVGGVVTVQGITGGTSVIVQGDVANSSPDTGNPVKVGGVARAIEINGLPTSVGSDGDRAQFLTDRFGGLYTRQIAAVTYHAVYRLATRPYDLSFAIGANARKQYATLHHTAGATKEVRLKRVEGWVRSNTAAAILTFDLVYLTTAPATGNPAITPTPSSQGFGASEAVALSLPTTGGTEGALISSRQLNLGITGAASVGNPPPQEDLFTLYSPDDETLPVVLKVATLEGLAIVMDSNAAATVTATFRFIFTEETP